MEQDYKEDSALWDYCERNSLKVNTDKTKIMTFKTRKGVKENKLTMLYGDVELELVSSFVYLGVEFTDKGELHSEQAPILQKAARAQFKLSQLSSSLPLETVLWLHKRMVDPILQHGSEVWGILGVGDLVKKHGIYETFRDGGKHKVVGEKMRLNFLRLKMEVPKYTPQIGIRGDSGFRPMYVDMVARTLKYFDLLEEEKGNSLLGLTLQTEKELWEEGADGWYGAVINIKRSLASTDKDLPRNWDWVRALERGYDQGWYKHLWSGKVGTKTLDMYRSFKRSVGFEPYLRGVFERHKGFVARLRLGGHGLAIEEGRKMNIPRNERKCKQCDLGEIGDEFHIFRCTWLEKERRDYGITVSHNKDFVKVMRDQNLATKLFIRDALRKTKSIIE